MSFTKPGEWDVFALLLIDVQHDFWPEMKLLWVGATHSLSAAQLSY